MMSDIGTAPVNIEVINPSTWTYVALRTVSVSGSWKNHTIGPWSNTPVEVFLCFAVTSTGDVEHANVDDVVVTCAY